MKIRKIGPLLFSLIIACAGCSKSGDSPARTAKATPASPVQVQRGHTHDEWKAAFESAFVAREKTTNKDGVTEFVAVFGKNPDNTALIAFARQDPFKKISKFTPGIRSEIATGSYVGTRIFVPDDKSPIFCLEPYFFSKNGWLFLDHVAVMSNGELVIDKNIESKDVSRDAESYGVQEDTIEILSASEVESLRKIHPDSKIIIRLSGEKGYVTLDDSDTKMFKRDIADGIAIYDKLSAATKDFTL